MSLIDTDKLIARKNIRAGDELVFHYFFPAPNADYSTIRDTADSDAWGEYGNANAIELINRPTPPIELPTKPTLGWARVENGVRAVGIWSTYTHRYNLSDQETVYLINPEREFAVSDVVKFIPGTLVPTSALDALRKAERITQTTKGDNTKRNYQRKDAILAFLADVTEANS